MRALGPRDRVVLDTLLPATSDTLLPDGVLELGFDAFYVEFQRTATRPARRAFRLALLAATWAAPPLIHVLPPLGRQPRVVRERALEAMATSRIGILRQLFVVLKLVTALAYGADPTVRGRVGYADALR